MDLNTYITERVDKQIAWYDKKCKWYKNYFFFGNALIIILSALIPFLTAFESNAYKYTIGFMGVSITVLTGILNLFGFYQKWLLYRSTSEKLKSEKHIIHAISDKLSDTDKLAYIKRIEKIILAENNTWLEENKDRISATS